MVSDRRRPTSEAHPHPLIYKHPETGKLVLCFHLGMTDSYILDHGTPNAKELNEEETDNSLDWEPGAGSKTGTNPFDCMGFVKPIMADASLSRNETPVKEGVEWEADPSSHRGDHFLDCLDQVRPLHSATKSTTGLPLQSSRTRNENLVSKMFEIGDANDVNLFIICNLGYGLFALK